MQFVTGISKLNAAQFLGIIALALVPCGTVYSGTYMGRVVAVADGDTVTVLDNAQQQHKVRLAGIDAPEKKQSFGQVSKAHLSDLIFNKTVTVETNKLDRYKREIGNVWVGSRNINLSQIEAGFAWHYKKYQGEQSTADRVAYARAEEMARLARKGLWIELNPTPPWEFRHR